MILLVLVLCPVGGVAQIIVDTALVPVATPSPTGREAVLPVGLVNAEPHSTLFVEIWIRNVSTNQLAIDTAILDVSFSSLMINVTAAQTDPNFDFFSNGVIDQSNGLVDELGGRNLSDPTMGVDQWARMGTLTIEAVTLGAAGMSLEQSNGGINLLAIGAVPWANVNLDNITLNISQADNGTDNDTGDNDTADNDTDDNGTADNDSGTDVDPINICDIFNFGCSAIGTAFICMLLAGFCTLSHLRQDCDTGE